MRCPCLKIKYPCLEELLGGMEGKLFHYDKWPRVVGKDCTNICGEGKILSRLADWRETVVYILHKMCKGCSLVLPG